MTINALRFIATLACEPIGDDYLDGIFNLVDTAIYYRFVWHLVRRMKPELVVELGVERGRCTAHIAAHGCKVLAVDCDPKDEDLTPVLKRYPKIDFRRDLSTQRAIIDEVKDQSVDICLFDSDHSCYTVMSEYGVWFQKMKPGGVMLFDDIELGPDMARAWRVLARISPYLERVSLPELHHSGFGAIIVK